MVLESLREGAPVNIKDLVIEPPRKRSGLPFDAKRDITKSDLRAMDGQVKADIKDSVFYRSAISVSASLKLLFPNRPLPVDFNDKENFELVKKSFGLGSSDAFSAKILYPQVQIGDYGETFRGSLERRLELVNDRWIKRRQIAPLDWLANLKLFNPKGIADILADDGFKDYVFEEVQKRRVDQKWYAFGEAAAFSRIILGDDFDFEISKEDWQEMHKRLEDSRAGNDWSGFVYRARNMQILAAEKVRVTPNEGLVLLMPRPKQDFRAEIPPLPQMRRF